MGVVYAAYDEQLDRRVAIKLLHSEATGESEGRARLLREAQAMAKVSHPNVAHVYEVGEHDGQVYIVMQYIDGQDLRQWAGRARSWSEVLDAYTQAGRGLAAAHAAGFVHRDFKPSNVMISADGHVRVLDFGLASRPEESLPTQEEVGPTSPSIADALRTKTGALVGTPAYMAPEVLRGGKANPRSDQFGYCVALFETVYRNHPFGETPSPARLLRMLEAPVPERPESEAPGWLYRVLTRGLRREPEDRFASMDALLRELETRRRPARRGLGLLGGAGLLSVGVATALVYGGDAEEPCPVDAAALGEAWSPQRRAAVETAFSEVPASFAVETWARVDERFERYAEAWLATQHAVCEATRVHRVQSDQLFDLRSACLQGRRAQFDALTSVLAEADRRVVIRVPQLLQELESPEPCAERESLESGARSPPPGSQDAVAEVERKLAKARALGAAGRPERAIAMAREAVEAAQRIDYPPLRVEATYELGKLLHAGRKLDEAVVVLRRAYFDAVAIDHDLAASGSAVRLIGTHTKRAEYEAASEWEQHAAARLERSQGSTPGLWRTFLMDRGLLAQERGDLEGAAEILSGALAFAEDNGLSTRGLRSSLGTVAMWRGEWTLAIESLRAAVEEAHATLGSEHPTSLHTEGNLAFAYLKKGDIEAAKTMLEDVLMRARLVYPDGTEGLDAMLNNAGGAYERAGLYDAARELFLEVHQMRLQSLGPQHPLTAHPLNNLGNVYVSEKNYQAARPRFAQALSILEAALGPDHLHVSFPLLGLGQVARGLSDFESAAKYYRRVAEIRSGAKASAESVAAAWLDLARVEWELDGRRDDSRDHAEQARDVLAGTGERGEDLDQLRAEVEQWIRDHPWPPG